MRFVFYAVFSNLWIWVFDCGFLGFVVEIWVVFEWPCFLGGFGVAAFGVFGFAGVVWLSFVVGVCFGICGFRCFVFEVFDLGVYGSFDFVYLRRDGLFGLLLPTLFCIW